MNITMIIDTWKKVLTNPNVETFEAERQESSATLSTAFWWMVLASVIAALLGVLQAQLFSSAMGGLGQIMDALPSELQGELGTFTEIGASGGIAANLSLIILGPIAFLIGVGIYHVIAKVLGGQGQYGRYAYLTATYAAPLMIVSSILGFVPLVGSCASLLLIIYNSVLTYFATRAEHQLSKGRAIVVVVAPAVAILALFICLFAVVMGTVVSAIQQ